MKSRAPTFDELRKANRKHRSPKSVRISFSHGAVEFEGKTNRTRADISADLIFTGGLRAEALDDLKQSYLEYVAQHPEVKRGGGGFGFNQHFIHCIVKLDDADNWLQRFFDVLDEPTNFVSTTVDPSDDELLEEARQENALFHSRHLPGEERKASTVSVGTKRKEIAVRVGQDRFSRAVKISFNTQCCFPQCDVDDERMLIGAHIDRWADNEDTRGEVSNGLCLCPIHDRAFELGLFVLSDSLCIDAVDLHSPWAERHLLPCQGKRINLGTATPSLTAIREHRTRHCADK